jgi:hypothetical protein
MIKNGASHMQKPTLSIKMRANCVDYTNTYMESFRPHVIWNQKLHFVYPALKGSSNKVSHPGTCSAL